LYASTTSGGSRRWSPKISDNPICILRSNDTFAFRRMIAAPSLGVASPMKYAATARGRWSGSAGEINVRVRTRSGRRAASRTAIAPPIELPTRCTGVPTSASMNSASNSAWSVIPDGPSRGALRPKPGRSTAIPRTASASSSPIAVKFSDDPPSPCTNTTGSAPSAVPGTSRTHRSVPSTRTVRRGHSRAASATASTVVRTRGPAGQSIRPC
jgi:hypothetical protein